MTQGYSTKNRGPYRLKYFDLASLYCTQEFILQTYTYLVNKMHVSHNIMERYRYFVEVNVPMEHISVHNEFEQKSYGFRLTQLSDVSQLYVQNFTIAVFTCVPVEYILWLDSRCPLAPISLHKLRPFRILR